MVNQIDYSKVLSFYRNKKVLITGHTGFKGSWLTRILINAGAEVVGYSKEIDNEEKLYLILKNNENMKSIIADINDLDRLSACFTENQPEIVFHLAAQPLVRDSYENPVYTYQTNVMGTVNLLECVRKNSCVKSVVNVTTDKVYKNLEWEWGYRENDILNGYDPYSNSKSCSELVTDSYKKSFFLGLDVAVSTARAGNVIGGGDFSKDRIIPDCIRFASKGEKIALRNPYSTRPYQHVLEPLAAYLLIGKLQFESKEYAGEYNVGPNDEDCVTTGELANIFCSKWGDVSWLDKHDGGPHEANFLKLDCSKIKKTMKWQPKWSVDLAVEKTVEWANVYQNKMDILAITDSQINEYFK